MTASGGGRRPWTGGAGRITLAPSHTSHTPRVRMRAQVVSCRVSEPARAAGLTDHV